MADILEELKKWHEIRGWLNLETLPRAIEEIEDLRLIYALARTYIYAGTDRDLHFGKLEVAILDRIEKETINA